MNDSLDTEDTTEVQLEIVELLDERFRLREDPSRAVELKITHARLRERLRGRTTQGRARVIERPDVMAAIRVRER